MYSTIVRLVFFFGLIGLFNELQAQCNLDSTVTHPSCLLSNGRIVLNNNYRTSTFSWSGNLPDTNVVEGLGPGLYFVSISAVGPNGEDCSTTRQITLTDQSTSIPSIDNNILITPESCEGKGDGLIDITVAGGVGQLTYSWSTNAVTEDLANVASGDYAVTVTDSLSCKDSLSGIVMTPGNEITIDMEDEIQIYKGGTVKPTIEVDGGTGYLAPTWSPVDGLSCADCLSPVVSPQETTSYTLTITDDNGCTKTDRFTAVVNDEVPVPFVPNTFTPNNDQLNDALMIYGSTIHWVDMKIFDRWGKLVGEITETTGSWNGNDLKGNPLSSGTYVYVLEFLYKPEMGIPSPKPITGSISLIREN